MAEPIKGGAAKKPKAAKAPAKAAVAKAPVAKAPGAKAAVAKAPPAAAAPASWPFRQPSAAPAPKRPAPAASDKRLKDIYDRQDRVDRARLAFDSASAERKLAAAELAAALDDMEAEVKEQRDGAGPLFAALEEND